MKIIVIYKSKTGFAKRYAQWISDELQCEMVALDDVQKKDIQTYDLIIYGTGLMAGKMYHLDKIKSLIQDTQSLILYATGAVARDATPIIEKIKHDNFNIIGRDVPFYYYEAGLNYEKMGYFYKKMLQMMYKSLKKKPEKTQEEEEMLKAIAQSHDHAKQEDIKELIQNIKQG